MSSPVKAPSQPPKASSSNTKKRKRADASQLQHPDSTVRFSLVEDSASLDPVLACAGALPVPNDVDFNVYKSSTNESSFIFGENRKQEWESRNLVRPSKLDQGQKPDDARGYDSQSVHILSCLWGQTLIIHGRYMLAVYNKRTNQAQLIPSPAHIIAPTLKRLKHLSTISAPTDNENRAIQRDALGTAFGSKRAKANIRAAERSKIDVSSADLQAYQPELQATLGDVLSNLPDTADLANMTASASLIPKFNVNASDPSEAYPIENIVSRPELAAMPIKDCLQASTLSERMSCMPTRQSAFAADALKRLVTSISDSKWDKPAKEKLRRLVYFVTLLAFNRTGSKKSMDDLRTKLGVADVVIEGLLERFTENIKGSKKCALPPAVLEH